MAGATGKRRGDGPGRTRSRPGAALCGARSRAIVATSFPPPRGVGRRRAREAARSGGSLARRRWPGRGDCEESLSRTSCGCHRAGPKARKRRRRTPAEPRPAETLSTGAWSRSPRRPRALASAMDFSFLFDRNRKLFSIGYRLSDGGLDTGLLRPSRLGGTSGELPRDRPRARRRCRTGSTSGGR